MSMLLKASCAHSHSGYMPNLKILYHEALRSICKIERLSEMLDWHSCRPQSQLSDNSVK